MPPDLPIRNHSLRILSELYAKGVVGSWGGGIPTGGMNAAAKTLGAWRYRREPAFAKKSGHTPTPRRGLWPCSPGRKI